METAIVLVVIGLILGVVLQGRSLIDSAEYKSFRQQLREVRGAFNNFRDRYGALPGDFDEADARLGLAAADNGGGNGVIGGSNATCDSATDESCLAWRHLRAADMLGGDPGATWSDAPPETPYGGVIDSFFTGTQGNGEFGHKLLVTDVPIDVAIRLDRDEDDEQCNDGRVSLLPEPGSGITCSGTEWPNKGPVNLVYEL